MEQVQRPRPRLNADDHPQGHVPQKPYGTAAVHAHARKAADPRSTSNRLSTYCLRLVPASSERQSTCTCCFPSTQPHTCPCSSDEPLMPGAGSPRYATLARA
eukprot:3435236-Pleurochrysis_carterae.AAC.1